MPTFTVDPGDISTLKQWLAQLDTNPTQPLRPIEIAEILLGTDVLPQLPDLLRRTGIDEGNTIVLVMDHTLMQRGEQSLKPLVQALLHNAGYTVEPLWLEGDEYGLVHADFEQVERVRAALRPGIALVALGSGTVTDIAKHAAYLFDRDYQNQKPIVYICCQTANSVTAFAANMAVLLKDGVKRTIPSRYPTAIISDLRVLASAPTAMTLAGLGDCCARFVAYGDWYLAHALGMVDFYSEVPLALLAHLEAIFQEHALAIRKRTYEGEAIVARALLLAGIAQSIVNMSTPISGTEHVTSHILDMIASSHGRGLALHGAQVGVATLTAARLYQHFLATFDPNTLNLDNCYPNDAFMQEHIQQLFAHIDPSGAVAQECWHDYALKLALWREKRPQFIHFCARWQGEYRPKLASLVASPETVYTILAQAGAPLTPHELVPPISQQEYDFAVHNGHFIRQRFVLGDLLVFVRWKNSF